MVDALFFGAASIESQMDCDSEDEHEHAKDILGKIFHKEDKKANKQMQQIREKEKLINKQDKFAG